MTSALYNTIGSLRQGVFCKSYVYATNTYQSRSSGRMVGENMPVISPDHIEK